MERSKAEDAGGLMPVKDDNAAALHFNRRTLPFFKCVGYQSQPVRYYSTLSEIFPVLFSLFQDFFRNKL